MQLSWRNDDDRAAAKVPGGLAQQGILKPASRLAQDSQRFLRLAQRPAVCQPAQPETGKVNLARGVLQAARGKLPDSAAAADQQVQAAVGPPERRLLSFQSAGLTIDLEVTSTNSSRGLVGQLAPPRQASVEIRVGDTSIAVEADDLGRFRAGPVPTGPMSLRCGMSSGEPGPAVVTDWVPI